MSALHSRPTPPPRSGLSRRSFLKYTGAAVAASGVLTPRWFVKGVTMSGLGGR